MPDTREAAFTANRPLLVGVAYRLLGSVGDAEDVVQEAWLRWARVDVDTVADPTAFLVRTVSRLAVDRLRRIAARRESYVGPWLPEPVLTAGASVAGEDGDPAAEAERAASVSLAMLVVLETLSPLERTVFVLHEAFAYSYPEIADILDRSPAAVRQLAHRAREHVAARRPRFATDTAARRAATERFLHASLSGDLAALMELLAPDAALWADGGGKVKAPRRPIHGADKIARFFVAVTQDALQAGSAIEIVEVNGGPAAVLVGPSGPVAVLQVDLGADRRVSDIRLIGNPDKLAGLASLRGG
jgi:RNA polymerase sigma-70 factor (TIGR02957 family)